METLVTFAFMDGTMSPEAVEGCIQIRTPIPLFLLFLSGPVNHVSLIYYLPPSQCFPNFPTKVCISVVCLPRTTNPNHESSQHARTFSLIKPKGCQFCILQFIHNYFST